MLYAKNLGNPERIARALAGIALAATGAWLYGRTGALVGGVLGASFALTGMVGYCPACAVMGRKPR
ncbi:DUF2892 domain-containing protein [Niveibacterium sp. SC-1]|uniref:YgaP family membrane protein n=1 Tax=Niveibacterium sp. SC-1 TaxID=3135646 RepID=UPI00311E65B3